jgi:SAM-dependent methyltransferase
VASVRVRALLAEIGGRARSLFARPRGERPLSDGRALLTTLLEILEPGSVLDVGRGEATSGRPLDRADVVVGLDVLVHPADYASYTGLVHRLLLASTRALVVSGPTVRFHEPLSTTLRRSDPEAEIYPLREEQGVTTCLVLKAPPNRHINDFNAEGLAGLIGRHPNPLRLAELRLCAWKSTGFYPGHAPRLWEYPRVADLVSDLLPPGSRVVDIGAGVTPLVPYLTSKGYLIDTVDPSPIHRLWSSQAEWTEWDFLDYAASGLALNSWNCTLDQLPRSSTFDGAYSVSVVEHLPAADRRALFGEIRDRLQPGGVVILTVDLLRGSDALWNRNRGLEIEPAASHGTIGDLLSELSRVGFDLVEVEYLRDWGQVVVDTCLVVARRT